MNLRNQIFFHLITFQNPLNLVNQLVPQIQMSFLNQKNLNKQINFLLLMILLIQMNSQFSKSDVFDKTKEFSSDVFDTLNILKI